MKKGFSFAILLFVLNIIVSCVPFHYIPTRINLMKNEQKVGIWVVYDSIGQLKSISTYHKGMLHGRYISYYDNKRIAEKGHYKKNVKDGKWYTYDSCGFGPSIVYYEDGQPHMIRLIDSMCW